MTKNEEAIERQQVEEVFGLTGGELEDEPWICWTQMESEVDGEPLYGKNEEFHAQSFWEWKERYWYEGPPEYVEREMQRQFPGTLRTLVNPGGIITAPHRELYDGQGIWKLRETFNNSGEAECPARSYDFEARTDVEHGKIGIVKGERCPLCDEQEGDEHGYIYLGVCSYEAVYELEEQHLWAVIVGNIGRVHEGYDEAEARKHFREYKEQSVSGVGRAGGESVILECADEPVEEFIGDLDSKNEEVE